MSLRQTLLRPHNPDFPFGDLDTLGQCAKQAAAVAAAPKPDALARFGSRFHHALELGPAVIGGGGARFDIGFDELIAARGAIGFALPALVADGNVMLGLPTATQSSRVSRSFSICRMRSRVKRRRSLYLAIHPNIIKRRKSMRNQGRINIQKSLQ